MHHLKLNYLFKALYNSSKFYNQGFFFISLPEQGIMWRTIWGHKNMYIFVSVSEVVCKIHLFAFKPCVHVVSVCMWMCIHYLTYIHMHILYILNIYYSYKYIHEYLDPYGPQKNTPQESRIFRNNWYWILKKILFHVTLASPKINW